MPAEQPEQPPLAPGSDRRSGALFVLGLAASAIGALDLIAWYAGAGDYGELQFAAATRGPGGAAVGLLCLLVVAYYLSRRRVWSLLILPVVGHAALYVWQASESYALSDLLRGAGAGLAESLACWHLWVDIGTIVLGVAVSAAALWVEGYVPLWTPPRGPSRP